MALSSLLPVRRFQKLNPALLRRKAPVLANLFNWNRKRLVIIPYFENRLLTADPYYPVLFPISLDKTLASGSFVSFIAREDELFPLRSEDGQQLLLVIRTQCLNQGLDRTFRGLVGVLLFFVSIAWPYRGARIIPFLPIRCHKTRPIPGKSSDRRLTPKGAHKTIPCFLLIKALCNPPEDGVYHKCCVFDAIDNGHRSAHALVPFLLPFQCFGGT